MSQGALFRLSDPSTSRKAAERVSVHGYTGLKAQVMDLLDQRGPKGATRAELQALLASHGVGAERSVISRRITDLRTAGLVEALGERDGMAVWVAARWAPRFGAA